MGGVLVATTVAAIIAGCAAKTKSGVEPFPVEDRAAVQTALAGAAQGVDRIEPEPARNGLRWSDVGRAAASAGASADLVLVELDPHDAFDERATTPSVRVVRARYIGVRDEPAELVVERRPAPTIYEATATVGLFGTETARAERLLAAFDEAMRAWGAKRAWPRAIDREPVTSDD